MKTLWILAAAATFAACHNRSDEDMGAAPDRGDGAAASGIDTTAAKPSPSTTGYDTTSAAQPTAPAPTAPAPAPAAPSAGYDTTSTAVPPAAAPSADTTMSPAVDSVSAPR